MHPISRHLCVFCLASTPVFANFINIPPLTGSVSASKKKQVAHSCDDTCPIKGGITLSGSFLWWKASENLSHYARVVTQENIIDPTLGTGSPHGHNHDLHYNWAPGFNVRLGFNTNYDCWDISLDWTRFHHTSTSHVSATAHSSSSDASGLPGTDNGMGIYDTWSEEWTSSRTGSTASPTLFPGPFSYAKAKWALEYDSFNLEFGKSFVTRSNLLRPLFGAQGALVKREIHANYQGYANLGALQTESATNTLDSASFKTHAHFWGVGPLFGVIDEFRFKCGWRFMGELAASFLYGQRHGFTESSLFKLTGSSPVLFSGSKFGDRDTWSPATHLQGRFGLEWAASFNHRRGEFLLGAAWEQNVWFFHNDHSTINHGDRTLELGGLTATMSIKF